MKYQKRKDFRKHSLHPSINFRLLGFGSGVQQLKQRGPDLPPPSHLPQLFQEGNKTFPGQQSDIVSPVCPGSASWPSPGWTCPKHLHLQASRNRLQASRSRLEASRSRLDHLNWLLLMWRSRGWTPHPLSAEHFKNVLNSEISLRMPTQGLTEKDLMISLILIFVSCFRYVDFTSTEQLQKTKTAL